MIKMDKNVIKKVYKSLSKQYDSLNEIELKGKSMKIYNGVNNAMTYIDLAMGSLEKLIK